MNIYRQLAKLNLLMKRIVVLILNIISKFYKLPQALNEKIHRYNKFFEALKKNKVSRKKFKALDLKKYKNLFLYVDPMPTEQFLNNYYNEIYWMSRDDQDRLIRQRDLDHFQLLMNNFKDFGNSQKKILNFGSGHGGVSILLRAQNHIIFNYEYNAKKIFNDNYHIFNNFRIFSRTKCSI